MRDLTQQYSTRKISKTLIMEIKEALVNVRTYGSVEIYVQDGIVTQITIRNIRKTNNIPKKK